MVDSDDWYGQALQAYRREWAELILRLVIALILFRVLHNLWQKPPWPRRDAAAYSTLILREPSGVISYSHPEVMPELQPNQVLIGSFNALYQTNLPDGFAALRDEVELGIPASFPRAQTAELEEDARATCVQIPRDLLDAALAQYATSTPGPTGYYTLRVSRQHFWFWKAGWLGALLVLAGSGLASTWWAIRQAPIVYRLGRWIYLGRGGCHACGYPLQFFGERCPECGLTLESLKARRTVLRGLERLLSPEAKKPQ